MVMNDSWWFDNMSCAPKHLLFLSLILVTVTFSHSPNGQLSKTKWCIKSKRENVSSLPNLPNHVSTSVCMSYIFRISHLFACFRHNHLSLCFWESWSKKEQLIVITRKTNKGKDRESASPDGFKLNFIDHLESKKKHFYKNKVKIKKF